jgi:hypothetical protein
MADVPTPPGVLTDEEFDQIQAAGGPAAAPPELQSFYLAQVNQYNAFRATHPRERDREATAKRLSALDDLALDPDSTAKRMQLDSILTAPPDQQAAAKDALLIDSHIAERLRRRTVIAGSVWDAGRPPDQLAVDRDAARDALAVETFGETAPRGSDAAVAGKLREAAQARRNLAWLVGGKDGADEQSRKINEASLARDPRRTGRGIRHRSIRRMAGAGEGITSVDRRGRHPRNVAGVCPAVSERKSQRRAAAQEGHERFRETAGAFAVRQIRRDGAPGFLGSRCAH